jgi:hypothetical protein
VCIGFCYGQHIEHFIYQWTAIGYLQAKTEKYKMNSKRVMTVFVGLMVMSAAAASSRAEIHEIKSMTEILPYINDQTLLVFDLDNTVIEPVQTLGSDQWFHYLNQSYTVDQSVSIWSEVQPVSQMRPVESFTPELILSEQMAGLKVMALTARPATLAQVTENQLLSIGVSFLGAPVYGDDITDITDMNGQGQGDQGPQYIRGIEFVSPKLSKGEALVQFLHQIHFKPQRIVFVDDTAKHTVTVNESLTQEGIENFEFRYGALDAQVAAFDSKTADIEFQIFQNDGKIISDDDARELEAQSTNSSFECR